jgi:carboxypeptidase PM20D1
MKKWVVVVLCVLAVIVVLGAVIAIRTMTFTSKQLPAGSKVDYKIDNNAAAQRLSGSIQFKTVFNEDKSKVDYGPFAKQQEYLAKTFPLVYSTLDVKVINDYGLLYTWKGSDSSKKPILLLAHQDVVPASDEGWKYPPFSGAIADGYIWGRGTLDDKSTLLSMLEAIDYLIQQGYQPSRTVCLASGFDEEITGKEGAGKIAQYLKDNGKDFEMITDEGFLLISGAVPGIKGPVALVGTAEKGYLNLELAAESQGGHSSMPPRQTTAGIVAAAVDKLEKNPFPAKLTGGPAGQMFEYLGPEMSTLYKTIFANTWLLDGVIQGILSASPSTDATLRTTTAPTMLKGSDRENVLPKRSWAVVNFRLFPGETIESVKQRVIKVIDDPRVTVKVYGEGNEASPVSGTDTNAFKTFSRTIRDVFPEAVIAPGMTNSASDATRYIGLSPNILRFLPQRFTDEELVLLHGTNERITVDNYGEMIDFYIQLIKNFDK